MNRRKFVTGAAAGAAGIATFGLAGRAQAPTRAGGQAPARGGAQGRGRVGAGPVSGVGNPGAPANVSPAKLARVSLMELNFRAVLIPQASARNPNPTPGPTQTLTLLDLPRVYVENFGVHNLDMQHSDIVKSETDPAYIKELKAKLDEYKVTMIQINLEFGEENISSPDAAMRQKALEHTKQWIDIATQYGCPRVMINQQQNQILPTSRDYTVATWKAMADYGKTKNVKVSCETRGAGTPEQVQAWGGKKMWQVMADIIRDAGAASNIDIGNVGATSQQELNDAIKAWFPYTAGNMHVKSSPFWDVGAAVRYTESLGYKGTYDIEVGAYAGMRMVYNQILANVKA